eukprot:160621-Rhodomonas_salina.2
MCLSPTNTRGARYIVLLRTRLYTATAWHTVDTRARTAVCSDSGLRVLNFTLELRPSLHQCPAFFSTRH